MTTSETDRASIAMSSGKSVLNLFQDNAADAQIRTTGASTGMNIATANTTPITLGTNNLGRVTVTSGGNVRLKSA